MVTAAHLGEELIAVGVGHAEQVGDHHQGERLGELGDQLTARTDQVVVEGLVDHRLHRLFVLLEALGRDQLHQQGSVIGVHRRVQCGQLVVERQLVAMCGNEFRHVVVAFHRDGEAGERSGDRDARREPLGVAGHLAGFLPAGHHPHAVMRFAHHRATSLQSLEVGERIGDHAAVHEEVHAVDIGHREVPYDDG